MLSSRLCIDAKSAFNAAKSPFDRTKARNHFVELHAVEALVLSSEAHSQEIENLENSRSLLTYAITLSSRGGR
jgi:hypothetical protein